MSKKAGVQAPSRTAGWLMAPRTPGSLSFCDGDKLGATYPRCFHFPLPGARTPGGGVKWFPYPAVGRESRETRDSTPCPPSPALHIHTPPHPSHEPILLKKCPC